MTRTKDGREWRLGTDADVAWIKDGTAGGLSITSAIPPVFDAYATIVVSDPITDRSPDHDRAVLDVLIEETGSLPWWFGYLDSGADDVVFPDAPRVYLYAAWPYVFVQASAEQAARWRRGDTSWRTALPDVIFPEDRSWLVSMLWDDDWRCVGGSRQLVDRFLAAPSLDVRAVQLDEDATPPGFEAR